MKKIFTKSNIIAVLFIGFAICCFIMGGINNVKSREQQLKAAQDTAETLTELCEKIEGIEKEVKELRAENETLHLKLDSNNTFISMIAHQNGKASTDTEVNSQKYASLFIDNISKSEKSLIPSDWNDDVVVWTHSDCKNQPEFMETVKKDLKSKSLIYVPEGHLETLYQYAEEDSVIVFSADLDYRYFQSIYNDCIENNRQFSWPHIIVFSDYNSNQDFKVCGMVKDFTKACCTGGAEIRVIYADDMVQNFFYYVE